MIKINLIAEAPAAAAAKRKRPEGAAAALPGFRKGDLILLLVLLISVAIVGGLWYQLKGERDRLRATEVAKRAERDQLQAVLKKVQELEARRTALQHKIEVINDLKARQTGPVRVMDEVSKALPDLVWLEAMTLDGNNLSLTGQAMDENAVANYIANLKESPYFKEPNLVDMSRAGKDSFRFVLTCVFTPQPKPAPGESAAPAAAKAPATAGKGGS